MDCLKCRFLRKYVIRDECFDCENYPEKWREANAILRGHKPPMEGDEV